MPRAKGKDHDAARARAAKGTPAMRFSPSLAAIFGKARPLFGPCRRQIRTNF
jgi:hypothetical protein